MFTSRARYLFRLPFVVIGAAAAAVFGPAAVSSVGVNNLFDEKRPDVALVPETGSFSDDAVLYDQLGLYVYAGFSLDF